MKNKKIISGICTIILALIIFNIMLKIEKNTVDVQVKTTIVKAITEIKKGDIITGDELKEIDIDGLPDFDYVSSIDDLIGSVAKEKIYEGEAVTSNRFANSKKYLVAKDNRKEYSVKLPIEDAVAGTLRPGDTVKISATIGTATQSDSEYVLQDEKGSSKSVRILRVYDANGQEIADNSVPATIYILDVSEEDAIELDKAIAFKKIKFIKD